MSDSEAVDTLRRTSLIDYYRTGPALGAEGESPGSRLLVIEGVLCAIGFVAFPKDRRDRLRGDTLAPGDRARGRRPLPLNEQTCRGMPGSGP
jgi:hypothetical protein